MNQVGRDSGVPIIQPDSLLHSLLLCQWESAAQTLETGKWGIEVCWESPGMLHSGGHTSWPFRGKQDCVIWTEGKAGHSIKGNSKYKGPERIGTACLGGKNGLIQIKVWVNYLEIMTDHPKYIDTWHLKEN